VPQPIDRVPDDMMYNLLYLVNDLTAPYKCMLAANCTFWLMSCLCLALESIPDTSPSGKIVSLYKVQGPTTILTTREYWEIFRVALFNMGPMSLIVIKLEEALRGLLGREIMPETAEFKWGREVPCLVACLVTVEMWFFWSHRLLHHPFLYRRVHKIHHRFKAPCAMAAVYAHPLEFIFGNVAGVVMGPVLTNSHPYTAYFWFALALFVTCKDHSGFRFFDSHHHDAHHEFYNYNYGNPLLDQICGTLLPKEKKR
jgi:sterol desaturase/sphingolipid hydroxylase (fatty acid hydroxylase superfamily)